MSKALSRLNRPGPIVATAHATTAMAATNSHPWLVIKKPLSRWTVQNATVIRPIIPAAASGVSNPAANSSPVPISVPAAKRAWRAGHFIPIEPNHAVVPAQTAAAEHLVVTVGGEAEPERDSHNEKGNIELIVHRGDGSALVDRDKWNRRRIALATDGCAGARAWSWRWSACTGDHSSSP